MNYKSKLIALVALLAVSAQPVFTQQQTTGHQIPFELVGVDTSKEKALSLQEAVELALASMKQDKAHITSEAADVLYHLLVLLAASNVSVGDVMAELERRQGTSGLAEKASRGKTT